MRYQTRLLKLQIFRIHALRELAVEIVQHQD